MATFDRSALPPIDLPTEEVEVDGLPGAVLVRGLDMVQALEFAARRRRMLEPLDGETEAQAQDRAGAGLVPLLLSLSVVLDDGLPVFNAAQWSAFGARHPDSAIELFNVAIRLSGQDVDHEKKA